MTDKRLSGNSTVFCDRGHNFMVAGCCPQCGWDAYTAVHSAWLSASAERDLAREQAERYKEALEQITKATHEGDGGFCYEPGRYRPCSCHVAIARKALEETRETT